MSADWLKMRCNLWDDPRVACIVDATDSSEAAVVGALYWLWATADQHSVDGFLAGLSSRQIDRKTGVQGFAAALADIGWIELQPEGVQVVRFDEHNGKSAKRRASESVRKMSARDADKVQTDCGQPAHLEKEIDKEVKQEQKQKRAQSAPTPAELFPDVDPDHLRDWVAARKAKRLPLTETAAKGFRRAAEKAGMTAAEAVKHCAERGWAGLHADFAKPHGRAGPIEQPMGKTAQALMALDDFGGGSGLDQAGNFGGVEAAGLLGPGTDPGGGGAAADRRRLVGGAH